MKALGIIVFAALALSDALSSGADSYLRRGRIYTEIVSSHLREGGVIESDPGKTTSESQSYGLLIAALYGDRETFDQVWDWTRRNLQVREDKLFAWLWQGRVADMNSATDADQDIALALLIAYDAWNDARYLDEARAVISDIWEKDTKVIAGTRYISGGNWALSKSGLAVNPSYLSPYSYRLFALVDREHDWLSLVDSSYAVLEKCSSGAGLPPDWCGLDQGGALLTGFRYGERDSSLYSYDALRVPLRVGLDLALSRDPRGADYLRRLLRTPRSDLRQTGRIPAVYTALGEPAESFESFASYGALLAGFSSIQDETASLLYGKISGAVPERALHFYDLAWLWFGLYFYEGGFEKSLQSLEARFGESS